MNIPIFGSSLGSWFSFIAAASFLGIFPVKWFIPSDHISYNQQLYIRKQICFRDGITESKSREQAGNLNQEVNYHCSALVGIAEVSDFE